MFFVSGTSWQLAVVLFLIANLCLGASLVIYDSLLCRIAAPDDRDKVSSKGWGFGYLGGGILLALNFGLDMFHARLGLDRAMSTRLSLLSAGLWWAGEAEFFSLYQAMERGTSWFGTLTFGLVHQFTNSYRWAIVALVVFFVLGGVLLSQVRMREGITAAGNVVPRVV